jgi:hypothetical protein
MTDKTKYLIAGGLGIAAVAYWYFFFYQGASSSTTSTTAPVTGGGTTSSVQTGTASSIQAGTTSGSPASWPPAAGASNMQIFQDWISTLSAQDQATMNAALPNIPQSDIAGLVDIATKVWLGGAAMTPAQTAFWNTFYPKYGILGA